MPLEGKDDGELMFGGTNSDLYTGELVVVPTTKEDGSALRDQWTADFRSVSVANGSIVNENLDGHIVIFNPMSRVLVFPKHLATKIDKAIGVETDWPFKTIPCSKRGTLPSLTLNLGGTNVTLTAYDYIDRDEPTGTCFVMTCGHDHIKGQKPYLRLGSYFFRIFYSVFDIDKKTVGCMYFELNFSSIPLNADPFLQSQDLSNDSRRIRPSYGPNWHVWRLQRLEV